MAEWRAVPDWPEYQVSDDGRVRRVKAGGGATVGRILTPWMQKAGGYPAVALYRNNIRFSTTIHRLVALAFIGPQPSPKHLVAHWDDDPTNNAPGNLRWATQTENMRDADRNGFNNRGERNGMAKLDSVCVMAIRKMVKMRIPVDHIADGFGIVAATVRDIQSGNRWAHLLRQVSDRAALTPAVASTSALPG